MVRTVTIIVKALARYFEGYKNINCMFCPYRFFSSYVRTLLVAKNRKPIQTIFGQRKSIYSYYWKSWGYMALGWARSRSSNDVITSLSLSISDFWPPLFEIISESFFFMLYQRWPAAIQGFDFTANNPREKSIPVSQHPYDSEKWLWSVWITHDHPWTNHCDLQFDLGVFQQVHEVKTASIIIWRCYFLFFPMLARSDGAKTMVNQTAGTWQESKQGHQIVH